MTYELKKLADKNLGAAITLAKHYRDLNQPDEAESICRDVLEVAPDDADALRTLGLTLTDRFPTSWMSLFEEACTTFKKLPSEYERHYYVGIAWDVTRRRSSRRAARTTRFMPSRRRSRNSRRPPRSRQRTTPRRSFTTTAASARSPRTPS